MVKKRNEAGADAAALECNRICETEYEARRASPGEEIGVAHPSSCGIDLGRCFQGPGLRYRGGGNGEQEGENRGNSRFHGPDHGGTAERCAQRSEAARGGPRGEPAPAGLPERGSSAEFPFRTDGSAAYQSLPGRDPPLDPAPP